MTEKDVIEHKNDKEFILKAVAENGKFLDLVFGQYVMHLKN